MWTSSVRQGSDQGQKCLRKDRVEAGFTTAGSAGPAAGPQSPSLQNGKSHRLRAASPGKSPASPQPGRGPTHYSRDSSGEAQGTPRGRCGVALACCRLTLTMHFPHTIPRNAALLPCQPASLAATPPSFPPRGHRQPQGQGQWVKHGGLTQRAANP
jgi:hypothetical protein